MPGKDILYLKHKIQIMTLIDSAPDGGSVQKQKSNPKLENVRKFGAIAVPVPAAPDPEHTQLLKADTYDDALTSLAIDVPLEIHAMDGAVMDFNYKIRKPDDLLEKGMVKQIPVMQELSQKQQELHRFHEQLNNSFRVRNAAQGLLESGEQLTVLIQLLLAASEKFSQLENE